MKLNALIVIAAIAASRTVATATPVNLSGTILEEKSSVINSNNETFTTANVPLKNATLYAVVSNAVAFASTYGTGIPSDTVPANGYIVYDPNGFDGVVAGVFYVTNNSGYYYPLSGTDSKTNYYNFVELDTYNNVQAATTGSIDLGFSSTFSGVEAEHFNPGNGNGTVNVTSTAKFYAHDNPYAFDAADNPGVVATNFDAIDICGVAQTTLQFTNGGLKTWSVNMTGTGSYLFEGTNGVITSSRLTLTPPPPARNNSSHNANVVKNTVTNTSNSISNILASITNTTHTVTSTNITVNTTNKVANTTNNVTTTTTKVINSTNTVSTTTNHVAGI